MTQPPHCMVERRLAGLRKTLWSVVKILRVVVTVVRTRGLNCVMM